MQAHSEMHWLDAEQTIAADELCSACRLTIQELHEIVGYGALAPARAGGSLTFTADWVMPLREAARLRRDFDLDLFAASLVAEHLHRIAALEEELRALRARFGARPSPRETP
jgi:chaperone modulatory protein CbpM